MRSETNSGEVVYSLKAFLPDQQNLNKKNKESEDVGLLYCNTKCLTRQIPTFQRNGGTHQQVHLVLQHRRQTSTSSLQREPQI